jgi:hypothetical protein
LSRKLFCPNRRRLFHLSCLQSSFHGLLWCLFILKGTLHKHVSCQRNVHHIKADTQPPPIKEQKMGKEKENIEEDCQTKKVPLYKHMPDKMVTISATLNAAEEKEPLEFLCKNKDVFSWSASDLHGVSRDILSTDLTLILRLDPKSKHYARCRRQSRSHQGRSPKAVRCQCYQRGQISSMACKQCASQEKNRKWRMCFNFTDLNKACPKDDFLLPRIDGVVDDAANSQLMSLLDCFSLYHQIWMRKEDEEKQASSLPLAAMAL